MYFYHERNKATRYFVTHDEPCSDPGWSGGLDHLRDPLRLLLGQGGALLQSLSRHGRPAGLNRDLRELSNYWATDCFQTFCSWHSTPDDGSRATEMTDDASSSSSAVGSARMRSSNTAIVQLVGWNEKTQLCECLRLKTKVSKHS